MRFRYYLILSQWHSYIISRTPCNGAYRYFNPRFKARKQ